MRELSSIGTWPGEPLTVRRAYDERKDHAATSAEPAEAAGAGEAASGGVAEAAAHPSGRQVRAPWRADR